MDSYIDSYIDRYILTRVFLEGWSGGPKHI